MKKITSFLIVFVTSVLSFSTFAQNGVVVSQTEINEESVSRIYLGQSQVLKGVNLPEDSSARKAFEESLVGKSGEQLKRHWAKLKFTGRGTPLNELKSDDEVISFLLNTPQGIGYVSDKNKETDELNIITSF